MKWYKYYKIYIGIGIFFALAAVGPKADSLSKIFIEVIYVLIVIISLFLGFKGRRRALNDLNYQNELITKTNIKNQKKYEKSHCNEIVAENKAKNILERFKNYKRIDTKVAGVTFKNDDGSSRQKNIMNIDNWDELELEEYDYKGKPAFYVYHDGKCIGNISNDFTQLLSTCSNRDIHVFASDIDFFIPDDKDKEIWKCEIAIFISK